MAGKQRSMVAALKAVKIVFGVILSVIFYMLVIVAISKMCTYAYNFSYQVFGNVTVSEAPGTDVDVTVNDSESTMSIASKLEYNKLVVNKYSFFLRAKLNSSGSEGKPILPGTYTLNTSMNYDEILSTITDPEMAVSEKEAE